MDRPRHANTHAPDPAQVPERDHGDGRDQDQDQDQGLDQDQDQGQDQGRRNGHGEGHGHGHGHEDIDWAALSAHLEREAELHAAAFGQAADWLRELLGGAGAGLGARAGRLLDVGSGPGVMTCVLAHAFPQAETVAVDQAAGLLDRVRERAAEQHLDGRVTVQQADLPGGFDALGTADLIWTSNVVHHFGDQGEALRSLAGLLRPGGVLAVVEGGLPARFLPRDFGLGKPGLLARMDAAAEDGFAAMRAQLPGSSSTVEDWPALLSGAGLVPAGTRTFLTDLPAPLPLPAREHLHSHLSRKRHQLSEHLDEEDRAALDALVEADSPAGILRRPDAFYLTATTVHTARRAA